MLAAKIYLQVQEVARDIVEESEVGPEQKSFEKCKEQLFKLSPSSNSEYHIFSVESQLENQKLFLQLILSCFWLPYYITLPNFKQNLKSSQVSSRAPFPTHQSDIYVPKCRIDLSFNSRVTLDFFSCFRTTNFRTV